MRELKEKDGLKKLETEKKLNQERNKVNSTRKRRPKKHNELSLPEKDKQLADALKETDETRRKLQQGSQQTQGEAFELEFEKLLQRQYPNDKILPVGKGIKGGDVIQEVWDSRGNLWVKFFGN